MCMPHSGLELREGAKNTKAAKWDIWVCDVSFGGRLCTRIYDNLSRANNEYKWWNKYKVMRGGEDFIFGRREELDDKSVQHPPPKN